MSFCQHCWSAHSISVSLSQPTVQSLHPITWRAAFATFSHYDLKCAIAFRSSVGESAPQLFTVWKKKSKIFLISLRCSVTVNYPDLHGNQGRDHYDVVWELVPSPDDSREEWTLMTMQRQTETLLVSPCCCSWMAEGGGAVLWRQGC